MMAGMDDRLFVLMSMPRTGSNMLVSALDSHCDATCLPAIFTAKGWRNWHARARRQPDDAVSSRMAKLPKKWEELDQRIAEMPEFLDSVAAQFPDDERIGFKHHMGPVDRKSTAQIIALKLPTIILRRRNILAAFSSGQIAKATGQGSLSIGQKRKEAKIEFDAEAFQLFVGWWEAVYEHWIAEIQEAGAPCMIIDYTEARKNEGKARAAAFLGLDVQALGQTQTVKRNPDEILKRFSNAASAERFLRNHDLMHWTIETEA